MLNIVFKDLTSDETMKKCKDLLEGIFHSVSLGTENVEQDVDVIFVENVDKELNKLDWKSNNIPDISEGAYICSENNRPHIIFISTHSLQNFGYCKVFLHELIHLFDDINFINNFCDLRVVNRKNSEYALPFYFWTEFHAYWETYKYRYIIELNVNGRGADEVSRHAELEFEHHLVSVKTLFLSGKEKSYTLYQFVSLLARFAIICDSEFQNHIAQIKTELPISEPHLDEQINTLKSIKSFKTEFKKEIAFYMKCLAKLMK